MARRAMLNPMRRAAPPEEKAMISADEVRQLIAKLDLCAQMGVSAQIDARAIELLLEVLGAQSADDRAQTAIFQIEALDADQNRRTIGASCDEAIALAIFDAAAAEYPNALKLLRGSQIMKEKPRDPLK
jgi:hypothetical protein